MSCQQTASVVLRLILCAIMAASAPVAGARQHSQDSQANHSSLHSAFDSALLLQKAGNLDRATGKYRTFLANAQGELAAEYAAAGSYAKSVALFKAALALQPDSPALRLGYAKTALLMGDPSLAQSLAQAFLNDNLGGFDQIAQAHQILGRALLRMNRDRQARDELQKAVDLDPSFDNRYGLAVVCLDLDNDNCAAQSFQAIEKSFGDTPAIHMQIGLAYGNSDFAPEAIVEFHKVIAEDPRYPEAHYALAAALLAVGNDQKNIPEAEAALKTELTISPHDYLTYAALGKLAVSGHRYSEAAAYLKQATALDAQNPDAFLYLGQMYFDTGQPSQAEVALRKAIALTVDPSRNHFQIQKAHFLLGRVLMQQHRSAEAHAEMQIARSFANLGLAHDKDQLAGLLNGQTSAGVNVAQSAPRPLPAATTADVNPVALATVTVFRKQITPAVANSYNNLGVIAGISKDYSAAADDFAAAANWDPAIDGLDLNWGRAAFMASRFSQAIPPLTRYVNSHPSDSGVRGALALSQFMAGNYSACIATFKGVESKLSSIPQMEFAYGDSLVQSGAVTAGMARLEKLEAAHPEIGEVHRVLGEVFAQQDLNAKAIEELHMAVLLNANDPQAHFDLGKAELEAGATPGAIAEFEIAVRLSPRNASFHRGLAQAYTSAGRTNDAEKERKTYEALENAPAHSNSATQSSDP